MELKLYAHTTIGDLKKQFSDYFPFLKLDFFMQGHKKGKGTGLKQRVHDDLHLIDVTGILKEGVYSFNPSTTVAALEQSLQNSHGLPVQVFRRSGDLWIETIQTDNLSLEKQNAMGAASVSAVRFNIHTLFL
ncbi:MAG TPA: hypothetical protein VFS22_03885 [Flavisolibacter sp.]|nr:hypothetical protein [Flavisolibacter sp.]